MVSIKRRKISLEMDTVPIKQPSNYSSREMLKDEITKFLKKRINLYRFSSRCYGRL